MHTEVQSTETKTPSRKYTRRSEAQWRDLINNFKQSELLLEAYCQHHKIAPSGFYAWRKRLECGSGNEASADTFIDITPRPGIQASPAQADNSAWQVELTLGPDCVLRIKTS